MQRKVKDDAELLNELLNSLRLANNTSTYAVPALHFVVAAGALASRIGDDKLSPFLELAIDQAMQNAIAEDENKKMISKILSPVELTDEEVSEAAVLMALAWLAGATFGLKNRCTIVASMISSVLAQADNLPAGVVGEVARQTLDQFEKLFETKPGRGI